MKLKTGVYNIPQGVFVRIINDTKISLDTPKYKVGDTVRHDDTKYVVKEIRPNGYILTNETCPFGFWPENIENTLKKVNTKKKQRNDDDGDDEDSAGMDYIQDMLDSF